MFNIIDLSIIIPHYNSPKLLKKLLDSIPKDRGIEIIVIDDSSKIGNDYYNNELKNNIKYNHIQFIDNESSKNGAGVCILHQQVNNYIEVINLTAMLHMKN